MANKNICHSEQLYRLSSYLLLLLLLRLSCFTIPLRERKGERDGAAIPAIEDVISFQRVRGRKKCNETNENSLRHRYGVSTFKLTPFLPGAQKGK
jgi:hypothetical protein